MITIDIDEASLRKIKGNFKLKKKQAEEKIKAGLKAGSLIITNEAKLKVPVLTGSLKRDIHDEPVKEVSGGFSTRIGVTLDYGPKIEFGGSRKAPAGYLRPALDEKGEEAIKEIIVSLKQIL